MLRATLPRAFFVAPDGSVTVNHDYFTSVELTENPQVVTYLSGLRRCGSGGTDHLGGHRLADLRHQR